ncbi:hypothetical protein [Nannocystis pusilla]|uniref:hypothetical protein n=1 Tax=Nannocystis pusilla TaxID=889268 RepID=UPI003B822B0B
MRSSGILLVSRSNPNPIPGAEDLPALRRPFSTPALIKIVEEALEGHVPASKAPAQTPLDPAVTRLKHLLGDHFLARSSVTPTSITSSRRCAPTKNPRSRPTSRRSAARSAGSASRPCSRCSAAPACAGC